jgi:hypothetical protein
MGLLYLYLAIPQVSLCAEAPNLVLRAQECLEVILAICLVLSSGYVISVLDSKHEAYGIHGLYNY